MPSGEPHWSRLCREPRNSSELTLYLSCFELTRFLGWDGLGLFERAVLKPRQGADRVHVIHAPAFLICGHPRFALPISRRARGRDAEALAREFLTRPLDRRACPGKAHGAKHLRPQAAAELFGSGHLGRDRGRHGARSPDRLAHPQRSDAARLGATAPAVLVSVMALPRSADAPPPWRRSSCCATVPNASGPATTGLLIREPALPNRLSTPSSRRLPSHS